MKEKTISLLLILTLSQYAYSQCESISVQTVSNFTPLPIDSLFESDGLRDGPDYLGATLYYPLNGKSNLKSIVLVPGFTATQESVSKWARYFATRGFICMTIGTNSIYELPNLRALALLDGMKSIRKENNRVNSPLYQHIDTSNISVGGWSMGGGGAQLAAKMDTTIESIIVFTPWLNAATLIQSDLDHSVPVLIFSGQFDQVAPPFQHADLHYDYTPSSTHKLLFEISGGDHYNVLNPNTVNGDIGNVAYAWLTLYADNNPCYCNMLLTDSLNQNSTASTYQTNLDCPTLSIANKEYSDLKTKIIPNPATGYFQVEFSESHNIEYIIHDSFGQKVKRGTISSGDVINIEGLPSGIYFLNLGQQEGLKIVIQ
ncbi:T9SS type A sorting domain-containing protein [Salibacteraceae bacterium]|jgi:dienelactone hydrolase|nr:T9SS type A sorting domain-containing protein [Salibacteraceae bacterium]HAQ71904.1 triacylglycerol lipase [Flavobacteriales bacterium]MDA9267171.1 T9SS type A sorting domain-containing protein [Salibacteraceae bacterium]MDB4104821.1 T9SS type A sorting domain-containing protein [Salibacteraceae bacterium]MDB9708871.1 T9SS type A sorting domain-containing protein [Salibacteraceae bacterium]